MLVSDAGSGVACVAELWRIEFLAVPCAASVVEPWRREFVAVPCANAGTGRPLCNSGHHQDSHIQRGRKRGPDAPCKEE